MKVEVLSRIDAAKLQVSKENGEKALSSLNDIYAETVAGIEFDLNLYTVKSMKNGVGPLPISKVKILN